MVENRRNGGAQRSRSRGLDLVERSWSILRRLSGAHARLYGWSRGRIGHRVPFAPRMLLLEHIGAKTGIRRVTPLVYTRDGDDLILVASKGGHPKNPAWFHNLVANPETEVQVGRHRLDVKARVATEAEHPRLWRKVVKTYSGFDSYQRHTDRKIPLIVLEPGREQSG